MTQCFLFLFCNLSRIRLMHIFPAANTMLGQFVWAICSSRQDQASDKQVDWFKVQLFSHSATTPLIPASLLCVNQANVAIQCSPVTIAYYMAPNSYYSSREQVQSPVLDTVHCIFIRFWSVDIMVFFPRVSAFYMKNSNMSYQHLCAPMYQLMTCSNTFFHRFCSVQSHN